MVGVASLIACASAPARAGHSTTPQRTVGAAAQSDSPARIVVGLCALSQAQRHELLARLGAALRRDLPHLRAAAASVPTADREAVLARLRENPNIAYAAAHDTLIVAAAGNDHQDADSHPKYPAAYPDANVISVAASDDHDHLADFSNYGKRGVDLAAPGDAIASTGEDGEYRYSSGTSMAAPLVAATAAMLRKQKAVPVAKIRELLLKTVDHKSALSSRVASGGRLNVRRALAGLD